MSQALKYRVPPAQTADPKEVELDAFLEALHESGILRALTGFVGQIDGVSEVVVEHMSTPGGRNATANALTAFTALTDFDSKRFSRLVRGVEHGLGAAADSIEREPPSLLRLIRLLNDEETRRGLFALLMMLRTVGRHVREAGR